MSNPTGQSYSGWVEIEGIYKPAPSTKLTTRLEFAGVDPDGGLSKELGNNVSTAEKEIISYKGDITVYGITEWQYLDSDGLNFNVAGKKVSAFRESGSNDIYIPHPVIVKEKLLAVDESIRERIMKLVSKRNSIILKHELDELGGIEHGEAVLNEFIDNINGLNRADLITVSLRVFINENVREINEDFHFKFISALLKEGMFLTPNTYTEIIHQLISPDLNIQDVYKRIVAGLEGTVTDYLSTIGFTHRPASLGISKRKTLEESGFGELFKYIRELAQPNAPKTIYIDLDRFFIKNDSLSNVVTIDYEYLRHFVTIVKLIQSKSLNISVKGLTERSQDDISMIQLCSIFRDELSEKAFTIKYNVDFGNYFASISDEDTEHIVSILSQGSLDKIRDISRLKVVTPCLLGPNRVNSTGYEFYAALNGLFLNKEEFVDLIYRIAGEILIKLVTQKQITEDEKRDVLSEIRGKGIGFIPAYLNPILYYKTIENQRALLTAA